MGYLCNGICYILKILHEHASIGINIKSNTTASAIEGTFECAIDVHLFIYSHNIHLIISDQNEVDLCILAVLNSIVSYPVANNVTMLHSISGSNSCSLVSSGDWMDLIAASTSL